MPRSSRSSSAADTLFSAAARDRLSRQAPLAARLRPAHLDQIIGQDQLVGPGRPLPVLVEDDRLSSAILWGTASAQDPSSGRMIKKRVPG